MPFLTINTTNNSGIYSGYNTLNITPTVDAQNIILSVSEINAYGVFNVIDSEFINTTVLFTNATTAKTVFVHNSDIDTAVTFGSISINAGNIAQISIEVGGATTLIGSQSVYDNTSIDPKTDVIVAASNSSAAWKARAAYVCDNVADEVEINNALSAFAGGDIYLAPGNYNCTSQIVVPEGTTLSGTSYNGSQINANFSSAISMVVNKNATVNRIYVIRVYSSNYPVVQLYELATVENCTISDSMGSTGNACCVSTAGDGAIIVNNRLFSSYRAIYSTANYLSIRDNYISMNVGSSGSTSLVGINTTGLNVAIDHNFIYFGTTASSSCYGIWPSGNNTTITNNYMNSSAYMTYGICLQSTAINCNISNNIISGKTYGIYNTANSMSVYNNNITGGTSAVFCSGGTYSVIESNTLANTDTTSTNGVVYIGGADGVHITDNVVTCVSTQTTSSCIQFGSTSSTSTITNNRLYGSSSTAYGVNLLVFRNGTIANNNFHTMQVGIFSGSEISNVAMTGNTMYTSISGVTLAGTIVYRANINDNTMYNSATGISITASNSTKVLTISGNNIEAGTGAGIDLESPITTKVTITGNNIHGNITTGIGVLNGIIFGTTTAASYVTITGNNIHYYPNAGSNNAGITFQNNSTAPIYITITGNNITKYIGGTQCIGINFALVTGVYGTITGNIIQYYGTGYAITAGLPTTVAQGNNVTQLY